MPKFTRRIKNNKKNITKKSRLYSLKRGGQASQKSQEITNQEEKKEERQGIVSYIGSKIGDVASSVATTLGDAGLKIAGLERIDKTHEEEKASENVNQNIEKIGDAASNIISDVSNVADKTGAAIIENVNEVLGSDAVKETTEEAAEQTAELVKEGAEKFNEALNNPEVKEEIEEAIENAGEVGSVVVKAAEKPFNEAVNVAAKSTSDAAASLSKGVVKVLVDSALAVPGVATLVEPVIMLDDITRTASAVVDAGSEAVEDVSDAFVETSKNVKEGLKELEEKKELGDQISKRTDESIKQFENPVPQMVQSAGKKTRKRFLKRKAKSKRVRFAI